MKRRSFFLSFVVFNVLSVSTWAQNAQPTPTDNQLQQQEIIRQQRGQEVQEFERQRARQREFERLKNISEYPVKVVKRESLHPLIVKPNREQRKMLEPDAAYRAEFAAFLQQPKTGLIKLFPDAGCEENARVLRADDNCQNSIPGGAFYSFRKREHSADVLADIRYKNNSFISDGVFSQGIFVALGNVPIETVSTASEGMRFLVEYKPESLSPEALKQFRNLTEGIKTSGYEYKNSVPALENTTYALRVIAYQGQILQSYRGYVFNLLAGDKRVDLTLAFRIVRREKDGSLTLLWKELERRPSPKVIFPKGKNKSPANFTATRGG